MHVCSKFLLLTIFLTIGIEPSLHAQKDKQFIAELVPGFNLSQLDGDGLSGFDKIGLNSGFRISYPLRSNRALSLGIFLDQRGSRTSLIQNNSFSQSLSLNYISMPMSYEFHSWFQEDISEYKVKIRPGLNISRLFSVTSSHADFDAALNRYRRWDFSLYLGFSYLLSSSSRIEMKIERSILKLYKGPNSDFRALQSYLIAFQLGIRL